MKLADLHESTTSRWEPVVRELTDPRHPVGLNLDQLIYAVRQWRKEKDYDATKAKPMVHGFVLRWLRSLLERFENTQIHYHLAHTLEYLKGWLNELNLDEAEVNLMVRYIDKLLAYREY